MSKPGKISLVTGLARPLVEERGLRLWDTVLEKEGSDWFLRIVMDGDKPVTLDDCEDVSRKLDKLLDEHDPIDHSYCLEVSSAGIGRKLKKPWHYEAFIGRDVRVTLIRPLNQEDGIRDFCGVLQGFEGRVITLETDGGTYDFNLSDVAFVKADDDTIDN